MDRRILFILIMSLAVPYGCSMALLGTSLAKPGGLKEQEALSAAWASDSREKRSFRRIRMDMEDPPEKTVDLETYLPIVVAGQISAESHPEAIKAQTILARTYICRQMEQMGLEEEIPESSLGLEKNRNNQMEPLWGQKFFLNITAGLRRQTRETEGVTLTWEAILLTLYLRTRRSVLLVREMRNIPIWLPYPVSMIQRRRDLCRK